MIEHAPVARIPRRHVLVALTFLATVVGYTDRVNISVAAVAMKEQLGWSQTQKGLVLSSFFVGYMLFMFASGWLATRFGGKRVLALSVLAWSVLTLLTPLAASLSLGVLVVARVGMGIGEAGLFPSSYAMFGRWVPAHERSRAVARLMSGIPVGTVLGVMVTGWLVSRFGWPSAFYSFGTVGLVWVALWVRHAADDPFADPRVGERERALLPRPKPEGLVEAVPWRRLLLRPPALAVILGHFAGTWNLYVLLAWLPSYFRDVQHLSIQNAGLFSAAPWLTMFVAIQTAATIADRMIARGVPVTTTRKIMQCTGLGVSALCLLAMQRVQTPGAALLLVCGATGMQGLIACGYAPGIIDIAPRHAALLSSVSNTIATVPGILGVAATGWLVDVTGTYTAAFVLAASVSLLGAAAFAVLFQARPLLEDAVEAPQAEPA